MPNKRRGAYQHKSHKILPIEETALGRTVPPELRKCFHRLLDSVWKGEAGAAEKRCALLDVLLDRLCTKPQCQLSLIFDACYGAATAAMVERGRILLREKARIDMEQQNVLRKRLERDHSDFQRRLERTTFAADPDRIKTAQQRSAAFVEILPILSFTVSAPRRPSTGRPPKTQWRRPAHTALQRAGCSSRIETRLKEWFRF